MATASKVATFAGKGEILISPEVARLDLAKCNSCGLCISVCPTKAIDKGENGIFLNSISCTGCGICVPACPTAALDVNNCTDAQLLAQIRGVSSSGTSPKIIAFLEKETPYASVDLAGQTRLSYSANIEIIPVPSVGRIGTKHLMQAFSSGADGVAFVEGDDGALRGNAFRDHVAKLKKAIAPYGIGPSRIMSTSTTIPQYDKLLNFFEMLNRNVVKAGRLTDATRQSLKKALEEAN
jgi:coenzyme F420-reducing hydrogenase delta subunit/Pyruvate/2-oxoacid:ferredoxin oxidoreductase delta subunit